MTKAGDLKRSSRWWLPVTCLLSILTACAPATPPTRPSSFDFTPAGTIVAGSPVIWSITYHDGGEGIAPGGKLKLRFPHPYYFMAPLNWTPEKSGVSPPLEASSSAGVPVEIAIADDGWHPNPVEVRLSEGLPSGASVSLVVGDTGPEHSSVAPRYSSSRFAPLLLVDRTGAGVFSEVSATNTLEILGGDADRVELIAPSQVPLGRSFPITVRLIDPFGNIARIDSALNIEITLGGSTTIVTFEPDGAGWKEAIVHGPDEAGVFRAVGRSPLGDEPVLSNPIVLAPGEPERRVYWADLHGHSRFSDGTGNPDRYFEQARGPAALDIASLSDHEWQLDESEWNTLQDHCRRQTVDGEFLAFLAWEFSLGGHRVVYAKSCDYEPPRPAFDGPKKIWQIEYNHAQIHAWNQDSRGEALRDWGDPHQLIEDHRGSEVLLIPHTSATWHMGNDWDNHDPDLVPLVEIYSAHGSSEGPDARRSVSHFVERGSVHAALNRGYRLGFIANGDSHDGNPGRTLSGPFSGGLTAVAAERLDRASVWDALTHRKTWATTGARMLLEVRVNGSTDDTTIPGGQTPALSFTVNGSDVLDLVDVVSDGSVIASFDPGTLDFTGTTSDPGFDGLAWYSIRAMQRDGHIGWSSPIWVTDDSNPRVPDLDARSTEAGNSLRWTSSGGSDAGFFRIFRRRGDDGGLRLDRYQAIATVESAEGEMGFLDTDPRYPGITTHYALAWIEPPRTDRGQESVQVLGVVSASEPAPDDQPDRIEYFLEEPGRTTITITNLRMQVIRTIEIDHAPAGFHHLDWDRTADDGSPAQGLHMAVVTSRFGSTERIPLRARPKDSEAPGPPRS